MLVSLMPIPVRLQYIAERGDFRPPVETLTSKSDITHENCRIAGPTFAMDYRNRTACHPPSRLQNIQDGCATSRIITHSLNRARENRPPAPKTRGLKAVMVIPLPAPSSCP